MSDAILVINAGSSSIKFALYPLEDGQRNTRQPAPHPVLRGQVEGIGAEPRLTAKDQGGKRIADLHLPLTGELEVQHRASMGMLLDWLAEHGMGYRVVAAGHRVVHGGELYSRPVLLSPGILHQLSRFNVLAPLHQPHNLNAIQALASVQPDLPQVACFDTAFHRSQPHVAQSFALPRELSAEGVKRYGFHGLSYEYIAQVLPEHVGKRADGRVVVCHLGNGASMCAMVGRRSQASTMGFTAVDGLVMGTRTGNLDPGVLIYLMENKGMDAAQLTRLLYKESGLLGVSGISQDMRTLLASEAPEAQEAVELFCYRISRELGSLAAAIGGLDVLVFTGGIGEHAAPVRALVARQAQWLGVEIDAAANARGETRISTAHSPVATLVIPTDEEGMIARHTVSTALAEEAIPA